MKLLRPIAALASAAALALSGCSTGAKDPVTSTEKAGADTFPVSIKHVYGTTTIAKAPKRIATLGWSDQDFALSLGVVPVGATKISWGGNAKSSTSWYDAKLTQLGAKEPTRYSDADGAPIEEIAKLAPDLILATNSGLTKAEYTKLSKLAPVVAYPGVAWGTPWQTSLDMVGKALGRTQQAADIKRKTESSVTATAAKFPQTKGKSFIFGSMVTTDTSKIDYYSPLDNRARLLVDLGMVNAPVIETLTKGKDAFFATISSERAATLKADVFVTYAETSADMATFLKDPLLGQVPAFKTGGYVAATNKEDALGMSAPSPLAIPWALDKFVPQVAAAVDRSAKS